MYAIIFSWVCSFSQISFSDQNENKRLLKGVILIFCVEISDATNAQLDPEEI